jgi:hypothetical protein
MQNKEAGTVATDAWWVAQALFCSGLLTNLKKRQLQHVSCSLQLTVCTAPWCTAGKGLETETIAKNVAARARCLRHRLTRWRRFVICELDSLAQHALSQ